MAACTSPEERLATHLERGEAYLEEGQPAEALVEFQSALNLRPDDAELYERVGKVLYARGRFDEALQHFEHAYRLDPTRIDAAMLQARILLLRNPDRAKQLVREAIEEDPDRDSVQRTKAQVALSDANLAMALEAANRSIELGPDEPENWATLGATHQARIRDRARRRRPPKDEVYEAALHAFRRVEALEPGDPRGVILQARVQAVWPGHEAEAEASFDRALAKAKASGQASNVVLVAYALDEYATARKRPDLRKGALRELIAVQPNNYDAWERLATIAGADDPLRSEGVYLELLEEQPLEPRAHLVYANYLLRTDRESDAMAHVKHVLAEGVDEAALWDWLVRMELRLGHPVKARAAFVELTERHRGSFTARSAEARMALGEGRVIEAAHMLDRLIQENESAELQRLKALAEYRKGRLPEAAAAIARSIALAPRPSSAIWRLRARVAHDSGRWVQVIESLDQVEKQGEPLSDEDNVQLAKALYLTGEQERALALLQPLIRANPPAPGAARTYAELAGDANPGFARTVLLRSFQAYPDDVELLTTLTRFETASGGTQVALQRLNTVVSSGQATPAVLQLRAELLASTGAYDEAEADLLRAFESNPGLPGAIDLLYDIYSAQGRLEEARRSFEQADEAGVLHPGARLLLARLYLGENQVERAREMLERVVEEQPELWSAQNELALVLANQGQDLDRAMTLARQAQLGSRNAPTTYDTAGWVHLQAGRYQAGLDEFRRAIRLAMQRDEEAPPGFRYHLGLALEGLGREEEAARAFEEALALGEFPEAEDARRRLEAVRNPGLESDAQKPS